MKRWLIFLVVTKKIAALLLFVGAFWACSGGLETDIFKDSHKSAFLTPDEVPDMLSVIPAPPLEESQEFAKDKEEYQKGRTLRDSERGKQAVIDTAYDPNSILQGFSGALGVSLSSKNSPEIYQLVKGVMADSWLYATKEAKEYYKRTRPFALYEEETCNPKQEKILHKERSYPSGHAALGRIVALALARVSPEHKEKILERGHEYGVSRIICGAHWASDVKAGEIAGSAIAAAEEKNTKFQEQLLLAKEELEMIQKTETVPVASPVVSVKRETLERCSVA